MEGGKYEVPPRLQSYFNSEDLRSIASSVQDAESITSAEIRVHINERLFPFQSPRKQALRVFQQLAMDQTKDRTGLLLYFTIQERRFEIVADQGITPFVSQQRWEDLARSIRERILEKGLSAGICIGVEQIGQILATYLPRKKEDVNELPNEVNFGKNPKP